MCFKCKKTFYVALITIISIIFMSSISYAKVPNELDQVVLKATNSVKNMLAMQIENYGIDSIDDIENSTVFGEGYPYYKISSNSTLDNVAKKEAMSIDNLITWTGNYIFPVKVGDKFVGTAIIGKFDGKWILIEMNSYSTFNDEIINTRALINKNYGLNGIDDDKVKLVYDIELGLTALSIKNAKEEYIIPAEKSIRLGLEKHKALKVSEIKDKVMELRKSALKNGDSMGGLSLDSNPIASNTSAEDNPSAIHQNYILLIAFSMSAFVIGSICMLCSFD